jgi:hypothetical protein
VAIDITEEVAAIRATDGALAVHRRTGNGTG